MFTPPTKAKLGTFALDVAVKSLDLYDDFFGKPYPLPKLDMIAIPEFAMGAMENWGLVTYREVEVLIAEGASADQVSYPRSLSLSLVCHSTMSKTFLTLFANAETTRVHRDHA